MTINRSLFAYALALILSIVGQATFAKNRLMLVDQHGQPVCNTQFSSLVRVAPNLYFGAIEGQHQSLLFDRNGIASHISPPQGFSFVAPIGWDNALQKSDAHGSIDGLFEVQKAGLHGIADTHGKFVVAPEYDTIQPFNGGIYLLRRMVPGTAEIKCRFFDANTRHLATAEFEDGKFERDTDGEGLVGFSVRPKINSLPGARPLFGYCDMETKVLIPPFFDKVGPFKNGLAIVQTTDPNIIKLGVGQTNNAGARAVFIDKSGKFVEPTIIPIFPCDEDGLAIASSASEPKLLGVINQKLHFVVPVKYVSLQRIRKQLFAAREPGANNWIAINALGGKEFDFPENVARIEFNPDSNANFFVVMVNDEKCKPPSGYLPHDCLIDRSGKVVIPSAYYLGPPKFGMLFSASGYRGARKDCVMDCSGKVLIPAQKAYFDIVEPDRIIKTVLDEKFNSDDWKNQDGWINRLDLFHQFLSEYNLIGMPYEKVQSLLGKGQELTNNVPANAYRCSYSLVSGGCGNGCRGFFVEFEDRVVKRWCFASFGGESKEGWFTENMIFAPDQDAWQEKMIPKPKQ
jgi:hypothetical protein